MRKSRFSKLEKLDTFVSLTKQRSVQVLIAVAILYVLLVTLEIPFVFRTGLNTVPQETLTLRQTLATEVKLQEKHAPTRPINWVSKNAPVPTPTQSKKNRSSSFLSRLSFDTNTFDPSSRDHSVELHKAAKAAWEDGRKLWKDLESGVLKLEPVNEPEKNWSESCPDSLSLSGSDFVDRGRVMLLPCGLTLGSHITVVGKPRAAHAEKDPKISILRQGYDSMMVSQFMMELQGLRTVEGEDPPRVLHFNPRLKGDWSGNSVIEINTCYRMQWGSALRCEGWRSNPHEETVDGQVKCEKWSEDDNHQMKSSKANWWLKRLVGHQQKVNVDWWSFPFAEEKIFVLTISAGFEGYHINVDGRHVTSFPYRTGFTLEDATGLTLKGDVDVQSIFAASLPMSHPSFASQRYLDMSDKWKVPNLPELPVELFIGILSAGNHFSERMAVRKSWMQHKLLKSSKVVARFFVALHARKEVNEELKKEAEFFGDVVIVPYMDNYDLVVLKTVAICEYGSRQVLAKYIMKCDDDTFVRVDAVINEVKKVSEGKSFYMGNINYYHKPLRYGKWAVTYEEWPEEDYPPYANGPGYILSSDIALFIVSEFEQHKLQLFKMEDVSVGMWVGKLNNNWKPVDYLHSLMFCQYGCFEGYYTAHYQSPRQMMCMWDRLQREGKPQCCDMR